MRVRTPLQIDPFPLTLDTRDENQVSDNELILPLDALVRAIGINKNVIHSLFLGAGASISSGLPSAEHCIWEWKRSIFLTNNPGMEAQFSELSLETVKERIQKWLDQQGGHPPAGSGDEYGHYIEQCYPIPSSRPVYFQEKICQAKPHVGYHLLGHLAQNDLFRSVWSTNFDGFSAKAALIYSLVPIEIGMDSQKRMFRLARKGELLCVSFHGDYRYDLIKNTPAELQLQEETLRKALVEQLRDEPCLVIGYSGRDQSVMDSFTEAYSQHGMGTLYWCGFGDGEITEEVRNIIHLARQNGRQAYYIPSNGFDDLMMRLALHCSDGAQLSAAKEIISRFADFKRGNKSAFTVPVYHTATIIKSNAFPIECPAEAFAFELKEWPAEKIWSSIKHQVQNCSIVAVPFRNKVIAFGLIDDIKDAFGNNIKGTIDRIPVLDNELVKEDGPISSLMREALVRSIAESRGIHSDRARTIWLDKSIETLQYNHRTFNVHESVQVSLRQIGNRAYMLFMPSIELISPDGQEVPRELLKSTRLRILGSQYNSKFNDTINGWRELLFGKMPWAVLEFPVNCCSTFRFKVKRSPIFAQIGATQRTFSAKLPDKVIPHISHKGFELEEPALIFSSKSSGSFINDTHPIRGILQNSPFDYAITRHGLMSSVKLGVVCALPETSALNTYLQKAHQRHRPNRSDPEYLLEYCGFEQAYDLPLEIAQPGESFWVTCPEPTQVNTSKASVELAQLIIRSIDKLSASSAPNVILVFIPERWSALRGFRSESERFDLHDFVKAYCVQKGVATQFLEQSTLQSLDQCSVWWWLSLALYAKSMRTPWVLDSLGEDTAFVGLGYSIDPAAERGNHIVLGCSHIYNARGEGLQYRLSKIDDPIFRGGNPYLSEEDARKVGENIKQLFYSSRNRLPKRVVLHKKTPFLKSEKEGLLEGLSGIDAVEMLELQTNSALRYMASFCKNGQMTVDGFPVKRGTVVKLDDYTALLWVHGVTTAVHKIKRYYQGRRRIPAPIIIRRHAGQSDLIQISQEIMALSKMNWNTFDLYTRYPATIDSSNKIARIGSLLERFGSKSYDYRLFF
jgi:hypothetical protein